MKRRGRIGLSPIGCRGPRPSAWRRSNSCGDNSLDLAPDFNEFCALLLARNVEFVVVGAHALAFHGAPRFTGDLDIFVRPTEANAPRVLAAIAQFGFPTTPLTPVDIVEGIKIIEMGVSPVQIHVMSAIDGVTWDEVWAGREEGQFGAQTVAFIGRDAFLRNKRAAGRPKDFADIDALRDPRS
jgi:hypothetical protein